MIDENGRLLGVDRRVLSKNELEVLLNKRRAMEGALQQGRVLEIFGPIADNTENTFKNWKKRLEVLKGIEPVVINISTPGGNSADAVELAERVQTLRNEGLRYYTLGTAYCTSVGIRLLMIGFPDGIFITPDALLQFHGSISHIESEQWATEDNKQIVKERRLMYQRNTLYPVIAKQTGKDAVTIERDFLDDQEFTAVEALRYGLVDGIYYEGMSAEEGQARENIVRLGF